MTVPVKRGVPLKVSLPVLHAQYSCAEVVKVVTHVLQSDTFKNKGAADAFLEVTASVRVLNELFSN